MCYVYAEVHVHVLYFEQNLLRQGLLYINVVVLLKWPMSIV